MSDKTRNESQNIQYLLDILLYKKGAK